jgi:hypothetical protein
MRLRIEGAIATLNKKAQAALPLPAPHSMICPETFAGDRGLQSLGIANVFAVSNACASDAT